MSIHGKWTEATVNPTSWCRRKKVLFQTKFHPRLCRAAVTAAHSAPAAVFLQAPEKYRRSQFQEEARRHRGRHYSDWQLTREKIEPPPPQTLHIHTHTATHTDRIGTSFPFSVSSLTLLEHLLSFALCSAKVIPLRSEVLWQRFLFTKYFRSPMCLAQGGSAVGGIGTCTKFEYKSIYINIYSICKHNWSIISYTIIF